METSLPFMPQVIDMYREKCMAVFTGFARLETSASFRAQVGCCQNGPFRDNNVIGFCHSIDCALGPIGTISIVALHSMDCAPVRPQARPGLATGGVRVSVASALSWRAGVSVAYANSVRACVLFTRVRPRVCTGGPWVFLVE